MWRGDARVLTPEQVHKRAGGRRWFNSVRQLKRELRWQEVARLRLEGYETRVIAAQLGVSIQTITRDLKAMTQTGRQPVCPTCGRMSDIPRAYSQYA